jgi:N-acetylglucosamine-6-phosphate deacetylase
MRLGVEAALVDGAFVPGDIEIADGRVRRVGLGRPGRGLAVPGFVDLQVNGFAGVDLASADADGYARAGAALLETGTTAYQPTFTSAPEADMVAAVAGMPLGQAGPRIIGAHLEGPFLSVERPGALDPAMFRAPDLAMLERLLAPGPVTQMTIAPELPGALALVDALLARGVVVSAGHTNATAVEAHAAFDRGVSTVTHLFNAMHRPSPRDPGIGFAALARSDVRVQLIVDGHHLAAETVRVAWAAAAARFALVTDAVAAARHGDGAFSLGGQPVLATNGVVRGPEGQLAGSALTMLAAVRNLHTLGIPLEGALGAASTVPARIARRPELGSIAPGTPADIVVLDDRLEIRRVLVAGSQRVAA